jgi:hypothetical protein
MTTTQPATTVHYIASNAHAWGGKLVVWCGADLRTLGGVATWERTEVTCPACLADMIATLEEVTDVTDLRAALEAAL